MLSFSTISDIKPGDVLGQKFIDTYVAERAAEQARQREAVCADFLLSGAFANELCAIQICGQPETWRLW